MLRLGELDVLGVASGFMVAGRELPPSVQPAAADCKKRGAGECLLWPGAVCLRLAAQKVRRRLTPFLWATGAPAPVPRYDDLRPNKAARLQIQRRSTDATWTSLPRRFCS
jgi:hypothetical protein